MPNKVEKICILSSKFGCPDRDYRSLCGLKEHIFAKTICDYSVIARVPETPETQDNSGETLPEDES